MHTVVIHYPGDPPLIAFLMFGKEFQEKVRRGKPGEIKVTTIDGTSTSPPILVHEIICDLCNDLITEDDPLCMTDVPSRVYCWECHKKHHGPHLVRRGK